MWRTAVVDSAAALQLWRRVTPSRHFSSMSTAVNSIGLWSLKYEGREQKHGLLVQTVLAKYWYEQMLHSACSNGAR
ncbi:hypothetical protein RJ639_034799 [Escallonia herrerae]|uniref:Uncharacterized protein n=1 Tax=Escallonia herrerae TaxID=1293975 RepID=A0AA88WWD8_9ASTE|nr:hypothetical protein RJ639_034799 [Escallonia herrerae]